MIVYCTEGSHQASIVGIRSPECSWTLPMLRGYSGTSQTSFYDARRILVRCSQHRTIEALGTPAPSDLHLRDLFSEALTMLIACTQDANYLMNARNTHEYYKQGMSIGRALQSSYMGGHTHLRALESTYDVPTSTRTIVA